MNRLLVAGGVTALAAAVLLHHPSQPPALTALEPPVRPQHFAKGHPFAAGLQAAVVYVVGAVPRPGLYRLSASARVDDAIRGAGGFETQADPASVNLAEHVTDGEEIRVLRFGEQTPQPSHRRTTRARKGRHRSAAAAPIDLNTADAATLASLPGIGPTLAERIVEYRQVNGAFASVDELADVAGMTQHRVDAVANDMVVNAAP